MEYIFSFLLLNITIFLESVVNVTTKHITPQCWNCITTTRYLRLQVYNVIIQSVLGSTANYYN